MNNVAAAYAGEYDAEACIWIITSSIETQSGCRETRASLQGRLIDTFSKCLQSVHVYDGGGDHDAVRVSARRAPVVARRLGRLKGTAEHLSKQLLEQSSIKTLVKYLSQVGLKRRGDRRAYFHALCGRVAVHSADLHMVKNRI